jgi:hypothetical protein
MSKRKYCVTDLTDAQLEEISKLYPKAVQAVRKPVYKVIAMLLECGLPVPGIGKEMTPKERVKTFLELAPIVYGKYWKTAAARDLGKTTNTIRNWRLGNTAPDEATIALLKTYAGRKNKHNGKSITKLES